MTAEALVLLANLGEPRRPAGAPAASSEAVLPDAQTAKRQLAGLLSATVSELDLPALRRLHHAAAGAAAALVAGDPVDCRELNAIAGDSTARAQLTTGPDGSLRELLRWEDASPAGSLARQLIGELAALEPARLRRCARDPCGLLFYDSTRSRTQLWHAEDPCGWRERQRRRRRPRHLDPAGGHQLG